MQVVRYRSLEACARLASQWDVLASGVPFRSWAWMARWWQTYGVPAGGTGGRKALYVLAVLDGAGELIGVAPWYLEATAARGRVIRFLGSGEVCSDYLSVLCLPGDEQRVGTALAQWLADAQAGAPRPYGPADRWDLLELSGVDAQDQAVRCLAQAFQGLGLAVHCRPGPRCWRIDLPDQWETFVARLSKNHRKRVRRAESELIASGRLVRRQATCLETLARAEHLLIHLHQRRHTAQGRPGCFASPRFRQFHHDVMRDLFRAGSLQLHWAELDGQPVAVDYQLSGAGVIYAYQSGMDPDYLEYAPGHLVHLITIRWAIEQGYRALDFLRGDEPYKAHWRAEPRPSVEIRVVAGRPTARLRHNLWLVGSRVKRWLKHVR